MGNSYRQARAGLFKNAGVSAAVNQVVCDREHLHSLLSEESQEERVISSHRVQSQRLRANNTRAQHARIKRGRGVRSEWRLLAH